MDEKPFVPDNFVIPQMLETAHFRLRMLSIDDVEKDYAAVMETQARFHALGYDWPREGFTMAENLADLEQHQREFLNRQSFAYTVVSPDESRVLGCVYINPAEMENIEARVRMWVRQSEYDQGLDPILFRAVKKWIESAWPFTKVSYPGRE
jgi:RimJ/RimL family protein N-acetyltransferase